MEQQSFQQHAEVCGEMRPSVDIAAKRQQDQSPQTFFLIPSGPQELDIDSRCRSRPKGPKQLLVRSYHEKMGNSSAKLIEASKKGDLKKVQRCIADGKQGTIDNQVEEPPFLLRQVVWDV